MMEGKKCRCPHHIFAKIVMGLGGIATILFLYTVWSGKLLFDLGSDAYFQHIIAFAILAWSTTRFCKCCCDMGCGKNCGTGMCMPTHDHGDMGMK